MRFIHYFLSLAFISFTSISGVVSANEVDAIIASDAPPPGIVFEIVSGDTELLQEVLPVVQKDIKRLRKRFPGLDVAIVTHGQEQFALVQSNRESDPQVHAIAESLVDDEKVSLHVCGTYATWNGVSAEEFPEFVDVTAAGPAQINDYKALGYKLIILP